MIFSGETTTDDFCKWLFSEVNENALVLAHNQSNYDSYFILQYLYNNAILPKVIPNGSKNMATEIPACNIKMIDSINFLPCALAKLPKMFGLNELAKGYFPHLFNRKENQNSILDHLPDQHYYNPDGMKPEDRQKFCEWYDKHKHDHFDFQAELVKYCRSDVDILRRCCLEFRDLFMKMTSTNETDPGVDPFRKCITIASACNLVFRRNFLKHDTIGIIPAHGYRPIEKHSSKALAWIKYYAHVHKVEVQHARNGGERRVDNYKLDGYYETVAGERVALEFEGCLWHGCPKCYSKDTINPVNGLTMAELYQQTLDKLKYLHSKGYMVVTKWECQFEDDMKTSEDIKTFVNNLDIVTPLEPRDAFYGGRTEAFKLYSEANEGTRIKYYDVTSLYPYINKTAKYVVGHPEIIYEDFQELDVYEGLIKCKVLAPRGLHLPILPAKINNKLMFALCKTCTVSQQQTVCKHTDDERAFIGTWVSDELKKAVTMGYQVIQMYEVWHFSQVEQYDPTTKTGGLFTNYINTFLKLKQEASGWPDWCLSHEDKVKYIEDYKHHEGISLEYENIKKNPGLRSLAKLMLNSFWGKFGQRSNMVQSDYITDPCQYFDILTSDQQEVTDANFVSEEMVEMRWKYRDDFIETSKRTNVVIAAYTTAYARLKLYTYLEALDSRVLYADTDSIIFENDGSQEDPSLGDYLGDLTDEVPNGDIKCFVTGGPKNYAFTVDTKNGLQSVCKVRGITLNHKNAIEINYDTMKDMVIGGREDGVTVTDNFKIVRNRKTSTVLTTTQTKEYKIVFDKRVIIQGSQTIPYGY